MNIITLKAELFKRPPLLYETKESVYCIGEGACFTANDCREYLDVFLENYENIDKDTQIVMNVVKKMNSKLRAHSNFAEFTEVNMHPERTFDTLHLDLDDLMSIEKQFNRYEDVYQRDV